MKKSSPRTICSNVNRPAQRLQYSREDIATVKQDIERWAEIDIRERKAAGALDGIHFGSAGYTHLNSGKHMLIDFFAKSPTLDKLFEQFLTDPKVSEVIERLGGKNLKLRGYNVRYLSGEKEYSAMEWHRDNRGELNIGFVLSETEPGVDGSTCFVPGSHLFPYCPFKSTLFPMPYPIENPPNWARPFSKILEEKTLRNTIDGSGSPGDAYIFLGDTWHARRPNLNGKRGLVLLVGLFPAEIPFPSHTEVKIPPNEILEELPPAFRRIVDFEKVATNLEKKAYVYEMENTRRKIGILTLWRLAYIERKIWDLNLRRFVPTLFFPMLRAVKRFLWQQKQRYLSAKT